MPTMAPSPRRRRGHHHRHTLAMTALLASFTVTLQTQRVDASVPDSDVLARCQAILDHDTPSSKTSSSTVALPASALPAELTTLLTKHALSWESLPDAARVGLLWAHGYILSGGTRTPSLLEVYTACSRDVVPIGAAMKGIALDSETLAAQSCGTAPCGTSIVKATNDDCSDSLASVLQCAVNVTTSEEPTVSVSDGAFWLATTGSTGLPSPQGYQHNLKTAGGETLALVSIHLMPGDGSVTCANDAIIPCLRLEEQEVDEKPSFCRPQVETAALDTFVASIQSTTGPNGSQQGAVDARVATDDSSSSGGLDTAVILGIVGGALVLLALLACFCVRRRRHGGKSDGTTPYQPHTGKPQGDGGAAGERIYTAATSMPPIMGDFRENDTVNSTDMYDLPTQSGEGGGRGGGGGRGRGEPSYTDLSSGHSSMTRSLARSVVFGKTVEELCEESEYLATFVADQQMAMKRIAYEEVTLLRLLSKGSYGEVYLGQLETRHVAVKKLLPEKRHLTHSIEQFAAEVRLMSTLEHRNIVSFLGVSWDWLQNLSVIVEYMDSGDLSEVLVRNRDRFSWHREKMSISMDVAEGLVYLHSMRPVVVHRDLKSKNILLNKTGQAKLSDFGVSRKTMVNETMTSGVGTLLWTAPEIIEGRKYSEKADIFSLGIVMAEIDTCEEPYADKRTATGERMPGMQLVQMVRLGQLTVGFRKDCPPKLRELALQCTSLDPDKRPTSMEVAYTLKSIIAPLLRKESGGAASDGSHDSC